MPAATAAATESIKVIVRVRPMNTKELQRGSKRCIEVDPQSNQVYISKVDSGELPKSFAFDSVYGENSLQQNVYNEVAFPLVESVIEGYNGTIFAYGQTGCGKTHTMVGEKDSVEMRGIIPNSLVHIFGCIDNETQNKKFLVRCSFIEIYKENIRDLLGDDLEAKHELKEDPKKGIYVKDLTTVIVKNVQEIDKEMSRGILNRKTGATEMNATSSRSHSIFVIYIETAVEKQDKTGQSIKAGKLNLVDLAGSEKLEKTGATGDRMKEGAQINLSLSALGNVISALVDGKSTHVPFRDSKLTRLLQDSLGGNTKTLMIAALSPADYNYDESLSTLRFADRAKKIKNQPKVNEDPKDALLRQYENEILKLREMIEKMGKGIPINNEAFLMAAAASNNMLAIKETDDREDTTEALLSKLKQRGMNVKLVDEKEDGTGAVKKNNKKKQAPESDQKFATDGPEDPDNTHKRNGMLVISEKEKQQKLEEMIKLMEGGLVVGGNGLPERDHLQAKAYREMQLKLKKQKKKEKNLLEQNQKKEEDMLLVEKNYKNLQEEVDDMRKVIKQLRMKYRAALNEITDLNKENELNREDLLDTIREQEKDLNFYYGVAIMMFKEEEMTQIRAKSIYDNDGKTWKIAPFIVKNKQVNFPQLKMVQAMSVIQNEKENRDIEIFNSTQTDRRKGSVGSVRSDYPLENSKTNAASRQNVGNQENRNNKNNSLSPSPMMAYEDRKNKYLSDGGGTYSNPNHHSNLGSYTMMPIPDPRQQKNQKALVHLEPLSSYPASAIPPVNITDVKKNYQTQRSKHPILDANGTSLPIKNTKKLAPINSVIGTYKVGDSSKNILGVENDESALKAAGAIDRKGKNRRSQISSPRALNAHDGLSKDRNPSDFYFSSNSNKEEEDLFS